MTVSGSPTAAQSAPTAPLAVVLGRAHRFLEPFAHFWGRISKKYYFEDYVRVYPDGWKHLPLGLKIRASDTDLRNFRNHTKFYEFAAQFVGQRTVLDAGCGSGYGSEILKKGGASKVSGRDLSSDAIRFARRRYGHSGEFRKEAITDLRSCPDNDFDVAVSSEVLEHVKEYGMADKALDELVRVVRPGGLIVIGTPNAELLPHHGFTYDEIDTMLKHRFNQVLLIENALVPFESAQRHSWEERVSSGRVGLIVSEKVNWAETVLPDGASPVLKIGLNPTNITWGGIQVDLSLLHNTHSWVALAIKPERAIDPRLLS